MWFLGIIVLWSVFGVVGYLLARQKGMDPTVGCLWGFFLGPIGWLIVALSGDQPKTTAPDGRPLRKCPACAEMVLAEASVCRYCQAQLPPMPHPEIPPQFQPEALAKRRESDRRFNRIMLIALAVFALVIIVLAVTNPGR